MWSCACTCIINRLKLNVIYRLQETSAMRSGYARISFFESIEIAFYLKINMFLTWQAVEIRNKVHFLVIISHVESSTPFPSSLNIGLYLTVYWAPIDFKLFCDFWDLKVIWFWNNICVQNVLCNLMPFMSEISKYIPVFLWRPAGFI